jgi:hypothetical protein
MRGGRVGRRAPLQTGRSNQELRSAKHPHFAVAPTINPGRINGLGSRAAPSGRRSVVHRSPTGCRAAPLRRRTLSIVMGMEAPPGFEPGMEVLQIQQGRWASCFLVLVFGRSSSTALPRVWAVLDYVWTTEAGDAPHRTAPWGFGCPPEPHPARSWLFCDRGLGGPNVKELEPIARLAADSRAASSCGLAPDQKQHVLQHVPTS